MIDDSNLEDRLRAAEWILNHPELNEPKNHAQEYIDFATSHGYQDVLSKLIAADIKNTAQLSDNEAINVKRSGDLIKSNELYIEFAAYNDVFDAEPMWGWFKIMLLAKNFSDAYVLLKYYHAIATSLNFLMRNEGLLDFSNAKISESFLLLILIVMPSFVSKPTFIILPTKLLLIKYAHSAVAKYGLHIR